MRIEADPICAGLQKHSIGDCYPAIVVATDPGFELPMKYGVQLFDQYVECESCLSACDLSDEVGNAYRKDGGKAAMKVLLSNVRSAKP